jgi:hypothetical protein
MKREREGKRRGKREREKEGRQKRRGSKEGKGEGERGGKRERVLLIPSGFYSISIEQLPKNISSPFWSPLSTATAGRRG